MVDYPDDVDDDAVGGEFVDEDSNLGQAATQFPARIPTSWLREFANLLAVRGRVPVNGNHTQIRDTILELVGGADTGGLMNSDWSQWERFSAINAGTQVISEALTGVSSKFMLDRWFFESDDAGNSAVILRNPQPEPHGYELDVDAFSFGQIANGGEISFRQRIEDVSRFAGEPCVVSIEVARGNASGTNTDWELDLVVVQNYGSAGGAASPVTTNFTPHPDTAVPNDQSFVRLSWAFTMPALNLSGYKPRIDDDSYIEIKFIIRGTGSPDSKCRLLLWGPKIERGSNASPYSRPPLQRTREACARFYQRSYAPAQRTGLAAVQTAGQVETEVAAGTIALGLNTQLAVPMRAIPTVKWYSPDTGTADRLRWNGADVTVSSTANGSRMRTGHPVVSVAQALGSVAAHFTADAEL